MARYVRGGDHVAILYFDFDKKRLMALKKADESLGFKNCYRDSFVISKNEFEQMILCVKVNAKSLLVHQTGINDDVYAVTAEGKYASKVLNTYEGKLFFRKLKNWIFYNNLPDLNRLKIPARLLLGFIKMW